MVLVLLRGAHNHAISGGARYRRGLGLMGIYIGIGFAVVLELCLLIGLQFGRE